MSIPICHDIHFLTLQLCAEFQIEYKFYYLINTYEIERMNPIATKLGRNL